MAKRPTKILLTLTGGGFLWQSRRLIEGLGDGYCYHFLSTYDSMLPPQGALPPGPVHLVTRITSMGDHSFLKVVQNALVSSLELFGVVARIRPDVVICIGTSLAVPLCLWARLFGKKAVFVESITRVSQPSLTGKILSRLGICSRFYVQWPEIEGLYRGAIYRGSVL